MADTRKKCESNHSNFNSNDSNVVSSSHSISIRSVFAIAYLSIRMAIANYSPILDCDEVYNYWEPLHYLLYHSGMQTWEYAPQYALRTFAYLFPISILTQGLQYILVSLSTTTKIGSFFLQHSFPTTTTTTTNASTYLLEETFHPHPNANQGTSIHTVLVFQSLRIFFAFCTAMAELFFLSSLDSYSKSFSTRSNFYQKDSSLVLHFPWIATWTGFLLLTSAGMFHSSCAFLPSSTVMIYFMISMAYQIRSFHFFQDWIRHVLDEREEDVSRTCPAWMDTKKQEWLSQSCYACIQRAIRWGLLAILTTGWPFCAILFIPLGFLAIGIHWTMGSFSFIPKSMNETTHPITPSSSTTTTTSTSASASSSSVSSKQGMSSVLFLFLQVLLEAVVIQLVVSLIDCHYYGKWVFPTWNIFVYNTAAGGDELYGTEPTSFYVKNLLLNWNLASLGSLLSLPLYIMVKFASIRKNPKKEIVQNTVRVSDTDSSTIAVSTPSICFTSIQCHQESILLTTLLSPLYLWLLVVASRPHKEERFLFPIFPLIAFGCVVFLHILLHMTVLFPNTNGMIEAIHIRPSESKNRMTRKIFLLSSVFLVPIALVSVSRSMALSIYYRAPLQVYEKLYHLLHTLPKKDPVIFVCTCGEWYRFPSSFHLPENTQIAFLKSSFDGQLPKPFTEHGSKGDVDLGFNDKNREEMDRYVSIHDCTFVIETSSSVMENSPYDHESLYHQPECSQYMQSTQQEMKWEKIYSSKFLNGHKTSMLHRTLLLPSKYRKVVWQEYSLYYSHGRSSVDPVTQVQD